MVVVKTTLADYHIAVEHLVMLAEEFFGKPLTNNEENGTIEWGFENAEGASDSALATGFKAALDSFRPQ